LTSRGPLNTNTTFFLGRHFVSRLLCTVKPLKNRKKLKHKT